MTVVRLLPEEIEKCRIFSEKCAKNQQPIEFGQRTTLPRGVNEIARDNMIGKMGEVAIADIFRDRYGIPVELDFNYYPRGKWDDQDLSVNGWDMDVKAAREGAGWLFIDWNKLVFRMREGKLAQLYVACTAGWDRDRDVPKGWVRIEGFVSLSRLRSCYSATKIFRKGDLIPGTNTRLQADNYGIKFCNLEHDLDKVVRYITSNGPPTWLTRNYQNPYMEISQYRGESSGRV